MNTLVFLLTNRSTGFDSDYVTGSYQPRYGDNQFMLAADTLRRLLKLDKIGTDWYWKPLVASVMSDKMCRSWFNTLTTVSPFSNKLAEPKFYNCKLAGTTGRPDLNWRPLDLPDSFEFSLTYDGAGGAILDNGVHKQTIRCTLSQGRMLVPDLRDAMPGVDFGLLPATAPTTGTSLGWNIEPTSYPVPAVISELEDERATQLLLAHYNVLDMYSSIPDDLFKLGLISAVIARATQDHAI